MLLGASCPANAVIYLDQTTTISGTGNLLRAYRVPARDTAGVVKYYDIALTFQQDATGKPVLTPANTVIGLSPTLLVGQFKAGKYRDGDGNYYMVGGPSAATNGRTSWSVSSIKDCPGCSGSLSGSWTTGPIAGHPIEATLKAQGITSTGFSWGAVTADYGFAYNLSELYFCGKDGGGGDAVGYAQSGSTLSINGYCNHTAQQTAVLSLSLCTTANPCP
jgi:hypothetical protein